MKVILLQDDKKLGKKGAIVNASDGFAFNSLIPRGIAKPATKESIAELDRKNAQDEKEDAEKIEQIKKDAAKIDKKKVTIISKAKGDKLFGSVTKKDIADAITSEHGVEIDEKNVLLDAPIKELTTVEIKIDYDSGVKAGVIVTVVAG
ncbi:MAG: 50S ribosomal protein L9 [Candidatus Moraniibacteriota bacterium]|jgi:large subunit ribosomal protein L9